MNKSFGVKKSRFNIFHFGASLVESQVKPLSAVLSHTPLVPVMAASLLLQLPADGLREAAENGPTA